MVAFICNTSAGRAEERACARARVRAWFLRPGEAARLLAGGWRCDGVLAGTHLRRTASITVVKRVIHSRSIGTTSNLFCSLTIKDVSTRLMFLPEV